jgi:hypothetical protein
VEELVKRFNPFTKNILKNGAKKTEPSYPNGNGKGIVGLSDDDIWRDLIDRF